MHGIFYPPADPAKRTEWRQSLFSWRDSTRALMNYDDSLYAKPEFAWVQRTFALGMVMMFDEHFYNRERSVYTLDTMLDRAERDFGGYDAVVLWHAYPKIGFDHRNQFDFYRDAPDGLAALREQVEMCHARGVKVYIDYNPWDTGTRREPKSDIDTLVDLVVALDADAIFLDTMANATDELRAKLDAARPGVSLESENLVPLDHIHTHPSSWAQGFPEPPTPNGIGVLRNKWFEPRHMQHRVKRWQRDHTSELQLAWMNGSGIVIWENVFGSPVLWSERDKSIARSMLPIQRRYADLFAHGDWTPLVETHSPEISATLWTDAHNQLWTLCNTSDAPFNGNALALSADQSARFYDLVRGIPLDSDRAIEIPARGIGAVLAVKSDSDDLQAFLASQRAIYARSNWDATPPIVVQQKKPHPLPPSAYGEGERAFPNRDSSRGVPPLRTERGAGGEVKIPAYKGELSVYFRVRECGFTDEAGVPTDLRFRNLHRITTITRRVDVPAFALDLMPVTNAQYAQFLRESGYQPRDRTHFLAHWLNDVAPPEEENESVIFVDLDDARAYAAWAGKRLPTDDEWQIAMRFTPFPTSRIWEWTESERTDGQTRFCILKGGSIYHAADARGCRSEWYADGGVQAPEFAAKFILSYPGWDRCATIGFRCASDIMPASSPT